MLYFMKAQNSYYKSNNKTSCKLYRLHLKTNQIYTSYGLTNFPSMFIEVPSYLNTICTLFLNVAGVT